MTALPAHSKLGASSMHRWSECPGSVRLSAGLESTTSFYAAEGTVAHRLAANCLQAGTDPTPVQRGQETILEEGFDIPITEEMNAAVQVYLDTIRGDAIEYADNPPIRFIEQKFHLKELHPQLFGTADCVQVWPARKLMRVYDYKHGVGVAVDVDNNTQLKYYALGALLEYKKPIAEIELVIVQPRCPHEGGLVRRHSFKAADLLDFEAELMAAVRRTEDPKAPLKLGAHCHWCPAAAVCPEAKSRSLDAAKNEFSGHTVYDPNELADTLAILPAVEGWAKTVREFAYGEALRGRVPPGFKLVAKRPAKKWKIDDHSVACELAKLGVSESDAYCPREVKSPAQIELIIGKGKKNADRLLVLATLYGRVSSGTKLVPESEPGQPINRGPEEDFK